MLTECPLHLYAMIATNFHYKIMQIYKYLFSSDSSVEKNALEKISSVRLQLKNVVWKTTLSTCAYFKYHSEFIEITEKYIHI